MGPINPKEWDVQVTINGEKVNLEEAFYEFENVFEDVDTAFDAMEKAFRSADVDIEDKINKLKMKMAFKHPDKFEYIPDRDEDVRWEALKEYTEIRKDKIRVKRNLYRFMIACAIPVVLIIAAVFFISISSDDPEFVTPANLENTTTITEKLEPL